MKLTNESNSKILGIIGGQHSCGIAYIENNEIKVVLEEERLIRQKPYLDLEGNFFRFPLQSLQELINRYNVDLSQVDYFTSFLKYDVVKQILKQTVDFDLPENKFIKTEHHETHCALAYYLSNFQDDTLVVAIDGSGEHHSAKYYVGTNGNMEYIDGIELNRKSLGLFYAAITELIGFKRLKDEGKTVGMAGHGNFWKEVYDAFDKSITVTDIKTDLAEFNDPHDLAGGSIFKEVMTNFFDVVGSKVWKPAIKDVALAGQLVLEEKTLQILNNLRKRYPHIRKIALAGGIFANVRMNKRINELEWVDEIFIAPPMGDEGLALGSALIVFKQLHPEFKPVRLDNVFFGTEYNEEEINNAAREILGTYNYIPLNIDFITSLLNNQKIVGLFQGKFEHGPRALGNRTIMCDATHPDTYDVINGRLKRNDFMPFAPAVLDEDADILFEVSKSRYAAEFMTLCFNTRDEWKDKLPTVVHPVDKTARVQIVTENSNPLFYKILKSYKEKTGIGCLVNTSFNVHNEPIVNRPVEAFVHLKNNIIDYLVTPYGIYSK
jgi:carbamoyltransferase